MSKTKNLRLAVVASLMAVALAGCGGSGGGGAPAPGTDPGTDPVTEAPSEVTTACTGCSAIDANTYAGSGIGVWEHKNTIGVDKDVPVSIDGLAGQDVTLVFTNETAADVAFPAIRIEAAAPPPPNVIRQQLMSTPEADPHAAIAEFNRSGWAKRIEESRSQGRSRNALKSAPRLEAASYTVGSTRSFWHDENDVRNTTLYKQTTTSDGTTVNLWVETAEFGSGKVTENIVDQLSSSFAKTSGIYDMLKWTGGPVWGPHAYGAELIAGTGQPIDIVVLNFDKNSQPYGMVGYFWGLHSLSKSVDDRSNESVSLYLDSETMYLGGAFGLKAAQMTMAHEGMHMSNFYRRGVLMSPDQQYDVWLEEMTAMMMEDAASNAIDPTYNPIRDVRLRDYLAYGNGNCALMDYSSTGGKCDGYSINGSFGGFLLRHYGVDFLVKLLNTTGANSENVLNEALAANKTDMGEQLRRFAVTTSGLLPANAPAGYGFPGRKGAGFSIPSINLPDFARSVPNASPANLKAYGNFMVLRRGVKGTFSETVRVPAGTTMSVVVR